MTSNILRTNSLECDIKCSFVRSLVGCLLWSFIRSFVRSVARSLGRSGVRSVSPSGLCVRFVRSLAGLFFSVRSSVRLKLVASSRQNQNLPCHLYKFDNSINRPQTWPTCAHLVKQYSQYITVLIFRSCWVSRNSLSSPLVALSQIR